MDVQIITIGDEILIGQIIDTNSAWIGQLLNKHGFRISKIITVGDGEKEIYDAIESGMNQSDLVLLTGGLGPTKDDITKKVIADYFEVGMEFSEETWVKISKFFEHIGRTTTPAHRQQCYMPSNVNLLYNKMGTAPGMWFEKDNKVLISMPGVPYEMKYIMEHQVLSKIKDKFSTTPIAHRTIRTAGMGESKIAERVQEIEANLPDFIKLAFLPNLGHVRLRLTGIHESETELNQILDKKVKEIEAEISDIVYAIEDISLEEVVNKRMIEDDLTIATAESCTGGYLAHRLTSIPGSSAYFKGSIVAYANKVKVNQLAVNEKTLEEHGAVSEETVQEMVKGCLNSFQTDIAIATSGIAGPTGGTPNKPVGTIWIAIGNMEEIITLKLQLGKNRLKNIEYTANVALNLLLKFLIDRKNP